MFDFNLLIESIKLYAIGFAFNVLSCAVVIILGLLVSKYVAKIIRKLMIKGKVDLAAVGFICSVVKTTIMVITVIISLSELGIELNSAVTAIGAAGLTASFALQGSLSNFVSGIQIIFAKPFKVDDFLQHASYSGTVKEITILNTILITPDNKEIIIPNSKLTTDVVTNFTSQTSRRVDLSYSIDYSTDIDKAKAIVNQVALSFEDLSKDNQPVVVVGKHLDSAVEIIAQIWVKPADYWKAYFFMQESVKKAFDENGIVIPFPQMDVHTK